MTITAGPMSPVDSLAIVGDGDALRARIREDGYLFFRGLLDRAPLDRFYDEALQTLVAHGWLNAPDPGDLALPARTVGARVPDQDPGYQAVRDLESFHRLAYEPTLADLMQRLVGEEMLIHPAKVLRLVYPIEHVPFHNGRNEHNDFGVLKTQDVFTAWVPFDDTPLETGPLAVKPGSHRQSSVSRRGPVGDFSGWAADAMVPGDVLVHHCMTTHAALPNVSSRLRISGEYRYQPASEPVPRWLVQDRRHPGEEMFARRWQEKSWWRPMPTHLTYTDVNFTDQIQPGPSRYVEA